MPSPPSAPATPARLLALALAGLLVCGSAQAQSVNRCVGADGVAVFTDRRCEDLGATPRGSRPGDRAAQDGAGAGTGPSRPVPAGCAGNPLELQSRLRIAAEARDLNALSALYHWPGATTRSADAVLASLRRAVELPLRGVELDLPHIDPTSAEAAGAIPHGIRLEHGSDMPGGFVPEPTRFGLVRNAGCWWIRY